MRRKKLKLCAVLLLGLGLSGLQAQSLFVRISNGPQTAYALSSIQKLTFSSGYLTITETDNNNGVYALNALQYLNFTDLLTSIARPKNAENVDLLTYPNPVVDFVTIDISGLKNLNGTLSILNIDGRLIKTQELSGSGAVRLDMSQFPKGIYLCQYGNATELKTVKIIKQ